MSVNNKLLRKMKKMMGVICAYATLTSHNLCIGRIWYDNEGGNSIKYELDGGHLTISGKGEVRQNMLSGQQSYIDAVLICEGITKICEKSFYECMSLESINMPFIFEVGNGAFERCCNLHKIDMPKVRKLGEAVFKNCRSLQEIKIPKFILELPKFTFQYCTSLKNVVLPLNVKIIGQNVFDGCYNLNNINIGCVEEIHDAAFANCSILKKVCIPSSVTKIGCGAFFNCKQLQEVEFFNKQYSGEEFELMKDDDVEALTTEKERKSFDKFWELCCRRKKKNIFKKIKIESRLTKKVIEEFKRYENQIRLNHLFKFTNKNYHENIMKELLKSSETKNGDIKGIAKRNVLGYLINDEVSVDPLAFDGCKSLVIFCTGNRYVKFANNAFSGCNTLLRSLEGRLFCGSINATGI